MDKYDSIDKIPSPDVAKEIAEDEARPKHDPTSFRTCEDCGEIFEGSGKARFCPSCKQARQLAGMRAKTIECESCGKTFHPTNGAVKLCNECRADKDRVREWKEKQGVKVVQAAKENGAECTNEHTHFPGLAEERRRKRQPVTVDLTNFIPKKMEEKHMETTADVKTNPEIDVIAIAKKVSNLCDDTSLECGELCAIIESFASGFVELRKGRKSNA